MNHMHSISPLRLAAVLLLFSGALMAGLSPGQAAADISLKDVTGKTHTLGQYSDSKAIVVVFLSTRCPVSDAYNDRIIALYNAYAEKGVTFLGVYSNSREELADIRQHAADSGFPFPVLHDNGHAVADQWDAQYTPEVFVFAGNRTLLYRGRIDDSQRATHVRRQDLRQCLEAVLAGKPVEDPETKAFGCSIKRLR